MAIGSTGFGFTGIGLEGTKGTAVAAGDYIPVTSADGEDATDVLRDEAMRASMATLYGAVKGTTTASYSMDGDVYVDTLGYLLAAIFGKRVSTGSSAPYTHTFTLKNDGDGQCPGYTIHDYQGLQARKYPYSMCSSLSLRVAAQELFTYSAAFTSQASVTESTPTPSFSSLSPIAGWTGGVTLAGSSNALIEELDLTLTRNVTPVFAVAGSSNPVQIWQGPLSVSGRAMFIAADETEFSRYLNVTTPSMVVTLSQGTSSVVMQMSKIVYSSAKVERGDDFTQVSVQFDAIANATDAGPTGGLAPAQVVLTNGVSGANAITKYGAV